MYIESVIQYTQRTLCLYFVISISKISVTIASAIVSIFNKRAAFSGTLPPHHRLAPPNGADKKFVEVIGGNGSPEKFRTVARLYFVGIRGGHVEG